MDQVRKRLAAGIAKTEHKTWLRKNDRVLGPILKGMGLEAEEWEPEFNWQKGDAYNSAAIDFADIVIVYATKASSFADYYVKKAQSINKIEVNTSPLEVERVVEKKKKQGPESSGKDYTPDVQEWIADLKAAGLHEESPIPLVLREGYKEGWREEGRGIRAVSGSNGGQPDREDCEGREEVDASDIRSEDAEAPPPGEEGREAGPQEEPA